MTARQILVAGIPSSGKSTFIAAMRHVLVSDETRTELVLGRLAEDERHLNALQERWLALERFDRTRETSEAWTTIYVRARAGGDEAALLIPDLRGEVFERPAATGRCLRPVADALAEADAVLLFTNAEKPDDDHLISDYGDDGEPAAAPPSGTAGALPDEEPTGDAGGGADDGAHAATGAPPRFRPDRMPEEAMIVELLQFANRRPQVRRPRRLAVVVSAWDAVIDGGDPRPPARWFAEQRPMLAQFLRHNADAWDVRCYGASAQGGALPRDATRLGQLENASERVIMVGEGAARHDPTAPIAWLICGG